MTKVQSLLTILEDFSWPPQGEEKDPPKEDAKVDWEDRLNRLRALVSEPEPKVSVAPPIVPEKEVDLDRSALSKFLEPSSDDEQQDAAIEKFRIKKQLRFMKKYSNNSDNDNIGIGNDNVSNYHWDATIIRVYGQ